MLRYALPALLWQAFITWLMLLPGKDLPKVDIVNFDKLVHTGVFAVLYWLYLRWLCAANGSVKPAWEAILLSACIAFGIGIELLQGAFYTDRTASVFDAIANSIGACSVFLFYRWNPKILLLKD